MVGPFPRFPLIQLPRKSEAAKLASLTARQEFPLIQLPRKSEDWDEKIERAFEIISINSTSEEVRSLGCQGLVDGLGLVSINSTSEEVRSGVKLIEQAECKVSINSTSEEVRRTYAESQ